MKKYKKNINLTYEYLLKSTYRYLERFATSENNLKDVLLRKTDRIIKDEENYSELKHQAAEWIDEIVEKCVKNGLVNDVLFAESKVRSFIQAGNSVNIIKNKLRHKGISSDIINQVIDEFSATNPNINLVSAIKYVRRRRFGPFRMKNKNEDTDKKEMAAMARAGFSYQDAEQVLKANREELEDILYSEN